MVQWLGLLTSTAGGTDLIPGWGTESPQAVVRPEKKKKKKKDKEFTKTKRKREATIQSILFIVELAINNKLLPPNELFYRKNK